MAFLYILRKMGCKQLAFVFAIILVLPIFLGVIVLAQTQCNIKADVMLAIDRSGTMSDQNKLTYAKTAAEYFLTLMNTNYNKIGLVSFDGSNTQIDQDLTLIT